MAIAGVDKGVRYYHESPELLAQYAAMELARCGLSVPRAPSLDGTKVAVMVNFICKLV